jgi:putative oxidoreductase
MSETTTLRRPLLAPSRFDRITAIRFAPAAQAILRIGAGLLFMQHGAQKLFGVMGGQQVELMSQLGVAGLLEFIGGALVVAGLFTRPVAALLALLMVVAYAIAHAPQGSLPIQNGGELALLYALLFGYLAASGAGALSLDARLQRSR